MKRMEWTGSWALRSRPSRPRRKTLLRARLCSWSYSANDEIRCELRLEPSAGVSAPLWVDWLAAQCCGFVVHRGASAVANAAAAVGRAA